MRYDDLTAPNTNDIPTVLEQFLKLGYLHGLWMVVSREGTRILVRFDSWLWPDSFIDGHMGWILRCPCSTVARAESHSCPPRKRQLERDFFARTGSVAGRAI
jgi:hypothetical protein